MCGQAFEHHPHHLGGLKCSLKSRKVGVLLSWEHHFVLSCKRKKQVMHLHLTNEERYGRKALSGLWLYQEASH